MKDRYADLDHHICQQLRGFCQFSTRKTDADARSFYMKNRFFDANVTLHLQTVRMIEGYQSRNFLHGGLILDVTKSGYLGGSDPAVSSNSLGDHLESGHLWPLLGDPRGTQFYTKDRFCSVYNH
jgi:hypothetical protein